MKKNLFTRLGLLTIIGLTMAGCSQNDDFAEPAYDMDENGKFHYTMELNCATPSYDDEVTTRSMTYSWENGAKLYIRFKSGSSYVSGVATYSSSTSDWNVETSSTLSTMSGEATCQICYFVNPGTANSSKVNLNEQTACFYTENATYSHPSTTSISIKASLDKKTWRLRFKGTPGTEITLPADKNEMLFYSSYSLSTGVFSSPAKSAVSLSVGSSGYTPYIYGTFAQSSGNNTIAIISGNKGYSKIFSATKLSSGESAFLTIPTVNSHDGWQEFVPNIIDPNATIKPSQVVTFTDGICMAWELGSTANTFDYTVFKKAAAEKLDDDSLASRIYTDPYTLEEADYYFKSTTSSWYEPNTEYCLCAVAKNKDGNRGPVLRYFFKTNSENLPTAEISNIKAETSTKWTYDITLKNNAKTYYLANSSDEDDYTSDWHWFAYYTHIWATKGEIEQYDWTSVATTLNSGTCNMFTVCTWGVDASNNIGNASVAYGNASSSSRLITPVAIPIKETMSKKDMMRLRNNTRIYRVDR